MSMHTENSRKELERNRCEDKIKVHKEGNRSCNLPLEMDVVLKDIKKETPLGVKRWE